MLMPKKVKYRKQQRGRMRGKAWRGSDVSFGDFGLKALEPCWLTDRFQTVVAERHVGPAPRLAAHAAALLFPELHFLRHQHTNRSCSW